MSEEADRYQKGRVGRGAADAQGPVARWGYPGVEQQATDTQKLWALSGAWGRLSRQPSDFRVLPDKGGPWILMLGSLAGLTRLRIHRIWQDSRDAMSFFCLFFQICGPPNPGKALPSSLAIHSQVLPPWGLQGSVGADLALRHKQAGTPLSGLSLGRPRVPSSPSPITGPGAAPGLHLGSAWWWPEWKIPHRLDYISVCQA